MWKSQALTLWDLCQTCTGDCQIPWDTGSSLPSTSMDTSKYSWDGTSLTAVTVSTAGGAHGLVQPFPTLSTAALGAVLQLQPQAELCPCSPSPGLPGPALPAPSLPFTAVFVFFPQLVFSVIHVSVHHISPLCVQRKERSPPSQQPCNGWTFPIRSELTACENNSLNY